MTGIQPKPSQKDLHEALQRLREDTYTQTDVQLLQSVFSSGQSVSALNRGVAIGGNAFGNIFHWRYPFNQPPF